MGDDLKNLEKPGTRKHGGKRSGSGRKPFIAKLPKHVQKQIMDATRAEYWAKLVTDHALPRLESILKAETKRPNDVQLRAIQETLNRFLGKPKDKHEFSGPDGNPIQLVFYSDADSLRLGSGAAPTPNTPASSQVQGDSLASESSQDNPVHQ